MVALRWASAQPSTNGSTGAADNTAVEVTVLNQDPPELTLSEAEERLDNRHERFVFFLNPETGRGNVIYRRYDGHYGLITPA